MSKITISDIAREAGVSITSVSFALNGQPGVSDTTRQHIQQVARRLGWIPSVRARSLSGRRAYAIGLVIERNPSVLSLDPFFSTFIAGVEAALEPRERALVLQVSQDRESTVRRYRRLVAEGRVDGVILSDLELDDHRPALLEELGLPAVALMAGPDFPTPVVRQDHRQGIAQIVRHLAAFGHQQIAHLGGLPSVIHTEQRLTAWRESMIDSGLQPGPVEFADFTVAGGAAATERLLGHTPRPTAIVCANDLMAIGAMQKLRQLGLAVPDDVSVTGYDGIEIGQYVTPALTTVITDPAEVGRQAAALLLDLIDQHQPEDVEIAPAKLAVRGSTGPAPA
ncbi:LacI family DNA-binding transcriptional regulator [Microlunatus soli]|uniref:DNA-binding transcriptional regulator, LacI/PurR family n=1 Tax=Microlunatus soli TaxID=630515 RepID=A0A1H1ZAC1_9ACTN|nr:LacI family DNA-binding transcriptional regulator [Microlunatus soli]SDT30610.1 DNA-binding transcriptional regulator, LacI/PurR family [Microlunatus soli]